MVEKMINFERGGNIMEKVGIGVKKDMPKVFKLRARFGKALKYHDSGEIHISDPGKEIVLTGKKAWKTIREINHLLKRTNLPYDEDSRMLNRASRLTIQRIFNISAGEIQYFDHVKISYICNENLKKKEITGISGGKAVWKDTEEIFEIKVKEIRFKERDFWFNLLGMDYD